MCTSIRVLSVLIVDVMSAYKNLENSQTYTIEIQHYISIEDYNRLFHILPLQMQACCICFKKLRDYIVHILGILPHCYYLNTLRINLNFFFSQSLRKIHNSSHNHPWPTLSSCVPLPFIALFLIHTQISKPFL